MEGHGGWGARLQKNGVREHGNSTRARLNLSGLPTTVRGMEEHTDGSRLANSCRIAQRSWLVLTVCLLLHTADANATGPRRHFSLDAGDATLMLNEFSRQSDLQVLFDFNILKGMKTRAVHGDYDASDALKSMLRGTNLVFDFVNERTLAVTPNRKQPSLFRRMWQRLKARPAKTDEDDGLEQVLISGAAESGTLPLLGAQTIQLTRADIDHSGFATAEDFIHALPQVFGGGPGQYTVLGREAGTNSARGSGINLRGLDAGATLVLIDGKRLAPSGTAGAFDDISNIPLGIIDHIDVLPDGASAKYGVDAVGGVVNFVTRGGFSGVQTQARGGGVTNGSMGERQFSQLFGTSGDSSYGVFSFEYFQRDALRAQDRWQETADLTPYGGSNFETMFGSPGTIVSPAGTWAIPKGQNGRSLTTADLVPGVTNLYNQDLGSDITPRQQRWSFFGKESLKLADDVGLFTEGLFTRRTIQTLLGSSLALDLSVPQSNAFYVNPTGVAGPVEVVTGSAAYFGAPITENRIDTGNFSLGLSSSGWHGWTASGLLGYTFEKQHQVQHGHVNQTALTAALADSNPATAFNPFGSAADTNPATLAAIGGDFLYDLVSTLETASLTATGPAVSLPGGEVRATVGSEYRIQSFDSSTLFPGDTASARSNLSRRISAEFAELRIPVIGESNQLGLARRLDVSLGVRHEGYSDVGSVSVPKFGLLWSPNSEVNVRGTWAKSFKPPSLTDLVQKNSYSALITVPDPSSPTGTSTILGRYGTNPDLRPESARTWTLGADFAPKSLPGLSFSLNYFDVSYSGRIQDEVLGSDLLSQPGNAWLVNRNFTAAQLNAVCTQSVFVGAPGSCTTTSISAIVDNRLRNIALLNTRGLDLIGRYGFDSPVGKFDFGLNGAYLFNYSQSNAPGSPLVDIVSTQNNPIDLKLRGSAAWTRRSFGITSYVNFANSYRDTLSVPNRSIASWTTVDLQLSYETGGDNLGWLGNMRFSLNAQNLFDTYPPFLNNPQGVGYDQENADLYGRIVSLDVRKRW
jgi:iron complex outermembrane receptor protein